MKYYKNENNEIWAYEDNVLEPTVKEGLIAITEDEANAILNPPKSDEDVQAEIVAKNTATQVTLTKEANEAIAILQDAFDLDMQEDGDEEKLKEWKKYRVLLTRVDLTINGVEWTTKPS